MGMNAEQPTDPELDHIRNTLTNVVGIVGKTRSEMHQSFDQQDKRFDQLNQEVRERFDQLELLIRQLLPNASH